MAIAEAYSNTATISTAEYSLVNNSTSLASITTDGVFQVFIDFSALTVTETYRLQIKEKVTSGGSQDTVYDATIQGVQGEYWASPSLVLMHGWDVTLLKQAGTDRSISWSIRQVS